MSTYKVTVSNNSIKVDTKAVKHETKVTTPKYATSLSRVGGQGSKGDSISSITLNDSNEIIVTVSTPLGEVVETFNLGIAGGTIDLGDLQDTALTGITDGQVVQYDSGTSTYLPHTLTTSSMVDVDNTNKEEGAVLVYDGTSSKYKATNRIENSETIIIGGSF